MHSLQAWLREVWPYLVTIAYVAGASWVTVDAVLRKRHAPAVVAWVGLAWLAPISGAIAYFLLGINRIQRSGSALERQPAVAPDSAARAAPGCGQAPSIAPGFAGLLRLGERVTRRPLYEGNRIEPLGMATRRIPRCSRPSRARSSRSRWRATSSTRTSRATPFATRWCAPGTADLLDMRTGVAVPRGVHQSACRGPGDGALHGMAARAEPRMTSAACTPTSPRWPRSARTAGRSSTARPTPTCWAGSASAPPESGWPT